MLYRYRLPIPKNTAKESPIYLDADMTQGIITHVEVSFPVGCYGLAGIQIWRGLHQVWPTNSGDWFAYDDITIPIHVEYPLDEQPYMLRIFGYNEDDKFAHAPVVRFDLEKVVAESVAVMPISFVPQLVELM
uniref:Uncharacterized protein n=1 Tax=viral metagenome TaxID=1070528 RepID=A0A6M3LZY4_9ZZZZ